MALANYIYDPLHILRPPQEKDYYDRQSRYAIPGLIRHNVNEVAVVGTSTIQDFDEDYFKRSWGSEISRYPLLGGAGYEQRHILEALLHTKNPPTTIIWGLDFTAFRGSLNRIRWAQFPEHLYKPDALIFPRYIFSFETFYRLLRLIPDYNKTYTPDSRLKYEKENLEYSKKAVFKSYCGKGKARRLNDLQSHDYTTQQSQIKIHIVNPIKQASDTEFILFFPPYSAVQYAEFQHANLLNDFLRFRLFVFDAVRELPNAKLYDFQSVGHIVQDLDRYRDPLHYGPTTTQWMADQFKQETHLLTSKNFEERQRTILDLAAQYSTVWQDYKAYCTD